MKTYTEDELKQAVADALEGAEVKRLAQKKVSDEWHGALQDNLFVEKQRAEKAEAELSEWVHTNKIDVLQRDLVKAEAERDAAKQALSYEQRQNAELEAELEAALAQVAGGQVPVDSEIIASFEAAIDNEISFVPGDTSYWVKQDELLAWVKANFATPQPAPVETREEMRARVHKKVLAMPEGMPDVIGPTRCEIPPKDWYCTRVPGHDGPCAAHPKQSAPVAGPVDEGTAFRAWTQIEYRNRNSYTMHDYRLGLDAWQARASLAAPPVISTRHAKEWWVKELESLMSPTPPFPRVVTNDQYRALNIALKIVRDGERFNYDKDEWEPTISTSKGNLPFSQVVSDAVEKIKKKIDNDPRFK